MKNWWVRCMEEAPVYVTDVWGLGFTEELKAVSMRLLVWMFNTNRNW